MNTAFFLQTLRDTGQSCLNVFFPNLCLACDRELEKSKEFLCTGCWNSIPRVHDHDPTLNILLHRFRRAGVVGRVFSPYYFEENGALHSAIHGLKYEGFTSLGVRLGKKVAERLRAEKAAVRYDCIVPVPLHLSKRRERGYNQSEFIASGIAETLVGAVVETGAVKRIRPTPSQTHLSVDERRENIQKAFSVVRPGKIRGKKVLIVDDVITSGATVNECARAVRASGAVSVDVASVALARLLGTGS